MRTPCLVAMMLACLGGFGSTAVADAEAIKAALLARIEEKRVFEIPEESEFVIETFYGEEPPPEDEIEKLERLAPPDAGVAFELAQVMAKKKEGGRRFRTRLFYASEKAWRVGRDSLTSPDGAWTEFADGRDGSWMLTDRQLQHARDGDGLAPDTPFGTGQELSRFKTILSGLATGIPWPPETPVRFGAVRTDGQSFRAEVMSDQQTFLVKGGYLGGPGSSAIRIDRVTITAPAESAGGFVVYDDWRPAEGLGRVLAHRRVSTLRSGLIEAETVIERAGPLTHDIRALTALPKRGDEVLGRGPATFDGVIEHTPRAQTFGDAESGAVVDRKSTRASASASAGGWALIAALVVGLGAAALFVVRKMRGA